VKLDIQARGFSLTEALLDTIERRADDFQASFPDQRPQIQVRLFDINGNRGGIDKGCLLHARLGRAHETVVASDVDSDMYRAIGSAFERLDRGARTQLRRRYRVRRDSTRLTEAI
jgi:putative sigma-54 modulation protein